MVCSEGKLIEAHPTERVRLDVVVAGEQHLHLRAPSPHLRQEWLVALGSAKAALNSAAAPRDLLPPTLTQDHAARLSQLRLYCDLLLQQVHDIKDAANRDPLPDIAALDDCSSMLGQTCDTFIRSLEECLHLAGLPPFASSSFPSSSLQPALQPSLQPALQPSLQPSLPLPSPVPPVRVDDVAHGNPDSFFATMDASFADLVLGEDGSVPTTEFLDACTALTHLLDLLGSTAFAPVKMDLAGNVRKLAAFRDSEPGRVESLQSLLSWEMERRATTRAGSATDALLWLKRGVWFLREFLQCLLESSESEPLSACASLAYGRSLKQHHGWVVRGVFSMAVSAVPTRAQLLQLLAGQSDAPDSAQLSTSLRSALVAYVAGIDRCLRSLHSFYSQHHLYPPNLTS